MIDLYALMPRSFKSLFAIFYFMHYPAYTLFYCTLTLYEASLKTSWRCSFVIENQEWRVEE